VDEDRRLAMSKALLTLITVGFMMGMMSRVLILLIILGVVLGLLGLSILAANHIRTQR